MMRSAPEETKMEDGDNNNNKLLLQVHEQVVNLTLPNRERATAAEVVRQLLLQNSLLSQALVGKRIRLIFSGRVLSPTDIIGPLVPLGAVVQCAIQEEETEQQHAAAAAIEAAGDEEEAIIVPVRRRAPAQVAGNNTTPGRRLNAALLDSSVQRSDFIVGFSLGFVVGPLMCFWLLERSPAAQKIGILIGIFARSLLREYHELVLLTATTQNGNQGGEVVKELEPRTSFELVKAV